MKKRTIVTLSIACALVVLGAGSGYYVYTSDQAAKKQAEDAAYQQDNTHVYATGETFSLNSEDASQGQDHGFATPLDWVGTMEVTLVRATLYDSPEDAGLPDDEVKHFEADGEDTKYLQCELRMKNVDAAPDAESADGSYNIGLFNLCGLDLPLYGYGLDLPERGTDYPFEPAYFDGTMPDATPQQGYHYLLDKGEEKTFKLGYNIPADGADGTFVYLIGIANSSKYQIDVDISQQS